MYGWNDNYDYEKEQLREQVQQYEQAERESYERRAQERMERIECYRRQADDWLEALDKQYGLFMREFNQWPDESPEEDDYFEGGALACTRAIELWPEEAAKVEEEIQALEQKIEALRLSIRVNVGKRLENESGRQGWHSVALDLQNEDVTPSSWLNW